MSFKLLNKSVNLLVDLGILSRGYNKYAVKLRYINLNEVIGCIQENQNIEFPIKIIILI